MKKVIKTLGLLSIALFFFGNYQESRQNTTVIKEDLTDINKLYKEIIGIMYITTPDLKTSVFGGSNTDNLKLVAYKEEGLSQKAYYQNKSKATATIESITFTGSMYDRHESGFYNETNLSTPTITN